MRNHARLRSPPAQRSCGVDLISDALPFGQLWYNGRKARFGDPDCLNEKVL
jgi:hypothetical protein